MGRRKMREIWRENRGGAGRTCGEAGMNGNKGEWKNEQ